MSEWFSMRLKLKQIFEFLISTPTDGQTMMYDGTAKKWVNKTVPKIWTGTATVGANGTWSVTFTGVSFVDIPKISATARGTSDTGARHFASIGTPTRTGVSGFCNTSTTVGLLVATVNSNAASGTLIDVIAIGV